MLPHWDIAIQPCLSALNAGPIIEIGAAHGATTRLLAEFAVEHDIVLHSVDPHPLFDVTGYERRFGEHFRFHRRRGHEVLGSYGPFSAALLGSDINWFTVHGDLVKLAKKQQPGKPPLPFTIVHGVDGLYARRDMYYDPTLIPEGCRQPWARQGIGVGEANQGRLCLTAKGGIHAQFAKAVKEGGARNGVLTAVEDFLATSAPSLRMRTIRGGGGLGIIVSDELLASTPALRRQWDTLNSHEFLLMEAERLSKQLKMETIARLEAENGEGARD